ncbi:MAG: hypothetical protein A2234_05910 [Elusimicrobia bacterium RIFOXYA2_FULL_58_8]|nr:MAG: hypothetical protein A2234_05910 [Elusimicrobia bacterium RIFOXYA2_FULL_58_8]
MYNSRLSSCLAVMTLLFLSAGAADSRVLNLCDDISDPLTLDPQKQFSEKNHTICQQIFEGLIRFDPEGKIEPALAVSWRRMDPLRVRFNLRKGVRFHNGELFTAEAVKFTIERYLDPATGFPARAFIDTMAGAEVVDSDTVDIITREPDGVLLNRLAGFVLMVPPGYIKEKGADYFAANPVGTGAFVFKEWEKGEKIVLTSNPGYWMTGYPRLEGLVFHFIAQDKQLAALVQGKVELITTVPGTQTLKVKTNHELTVLKKPSFYTMPFSLNVTTGPLSNLDVRKALNYAFNKERLIRYDLLGNGKPIATFSMEGELGHNASLAPYAFDIHRAKELLARAGYPAGFSLKVLVKSNADRTAKIAASEFRNIGVRLEIVSVSDADSIREFARGGYAMAIGDVPDPMCHSYFIQAMLLSSKSPYCLGADPQIDILLKEIVAATDEKAAKETADKADKYVYDNALGVFTYQKTAIYGLRRELSFTPYLSRMPYFYMDHFRENAYEKKH